MIPFIYVSKTDFTARNFPIEQTYARGPQFLAKHEYIIALSGLSTLKILYSTFRQVETLHRRQRDVGGKVAAARTTSDHQAG